MVHAGFSFIFSSFSSFYIQKKLSSLQLTNFVVSKMVMNNFIQLIQKKLLHIQFYICCYMEGKEKRNIILEMKEKFKKVKDGGTFFIVAKIYDRPKFQDV